MGTRTESIDVLHVDDEADFAETAATFLEREDDRFEVETALSANEGLDRLAEGEYQCVVSDYDMPGQNGIGFLEAVRESHPDVPFILYTGKGSEEVASDAISTGATDYLQKGTGTDQYAVLANRITNAVEQYRTQQRLAETRTWYQTVLEHSSDYVMIVDGNGIVQDVTPPVERVLGYLPEEIIGVNAFETVHEADRETAAGAFSRLVTRPDQPQTVEFRAEHADGSYRWLEVRGRNMLDDPVIEGVLVNVRDITDRKQGQQELSQLQQLFEGFAETVPDAFFLKSADYSETHYVNSAVETIYGVTPTEEYEDPRSWLTHVHPDDKAELVAEIEGQHHESKTWPREHEYRVQHPERGLRWVKTRMDELVADGTRRIAGVARDITERRRRERDLQRQNERLEEFASVIAHDLRNPLTVAEGQLALAREECESEHLPAASESVQRSLELIEDLLELARDGEGASEAETVDFADLALDCWQNVETAEATLRARIDRAVEADRSRLAQLLENLIRNAVEHGGGGVTVTVGELEDGFYVEDTGPGIPEDRREEIFDAGYSTAADGTGFGLSIVKQVADAHGWDVHVTEGADDGARFEITGVGTSA